jgi:hypothetical protein
MSALPVPQLKQTAGKWVCLRSDSLTRLAAVELLARKDEAELPEEVASILKQFTMDKPENLPLRLWVQLDGIEWAVQKQDEKMRVDAALKILIRAQAHYPLIRRLFNISRNSWRVEREQLKAKVAPASYKALNAKQINLLYNTWARLLKEYDNDIDRWVILSKEYASTPLAVLYPLIYPEGDLDA